MNCIYCKCYLSDETTVRTKIGWLASYDCNLCNVSFILNTNNSIYRIEYTIDNKYFLRLDFDSNFCIVYNPPTNIPDYKLFDIPYIPKDLTPQNARIFIDKILNLKAFL